MDLGAKAGFLVSTTQSASLPRVVISLFRGKLPVCRPVHPSCAARAGSGRCLRVQSHCCYFKALIPQVSFSAGKWLYFLTSCLRSEPAFLSPNHPRPSLGVAQRRRSKIPVSPQWKGALPLPLAASQLTLQRPLDGRRILNRTWELSSSPPFF